ncbi:short-chain dehydrogenase [Actinotalea fermentans ATCC 43279 = JCM 9966 = DSM 3133]|nr:short-chain dehydrogenase [Actinotalea fermentans ATCC 43279 = JCM 9966 = DSM 3133]
MAGQRVWVVGASSGIGAALATELAARGAQVAISARRADRLADVARGRMTAVPLDATDDRAVATAAQAVREVLGGLDTVVWSAGHWQRSDPRTWDGPAFAEHVRVNLLGLNNVLSAVLPAMVRRRSGHVVAIASVAGYRGLPGAEAYGSTKAAQIALLESLRASLRHDGVRVTTVAPGFVRTEMTAVNTFPMPFIVEADQAARAIADGLERGRVEIVFPWRMALVMKAARLVPVRAWAALVSPRRRREAARGA